MADVLGSFSKGFALGEQVIGSMDRRERQKKADERDETLWQQQQEDRKTRLADAQTARERGETTWQQQQEDRKTRLSDAQTARERGETTWQQQQEDRELRLSDQETARKRGDTRWNEEVRGYNHQNMLRERKIGEQLTADWLNGMAERGEWSDPPAELQEYYDNNPHLDISNVLMPSNVVGRQQARQLMQQMANGEQINRKDPRLTQALTELFPEIIANKSLPTEYKGKLITKREIGAVTMAPQGNGFIVEQRLTLDDGSVVNEPVTQNRTSDPNDNPAIIPFELASQRLATYDDMDLGFDDASKQQLMTSRIIRGLAKEGVDTKSSGALKKQMLSSLDTLEKEEAKAVAGAFPEERDAIKQTYKEAKDRVRTSYEQIMGGAKEKQAPEAGRTLDPKLRADTIKTVDTMAQQNNITLTPEVRAEIGQAVDKGATAEQIFEAIQARYGDPTYVSEEQAVGIVDAILSDLKGANSGDIGPLASRQLSPDAETSLAPPTIQPTQTPTGSQEEIAARARQAQSGGGSNRYSLSGADGALAQAYGGQR